tara:strand:- start:946 stop:1968 length:1023 start_codon:yes stop_codon:yes gene_type:complete
MGYLDNSGDIILDAVLTDTGRARLAKGDGSFRIVKFALGDDEIDYSLFNVNANTGYEDLRILKLPIFEAFTNNTSTLNSKLLTYSNNTSLLYLPVVKNLDTTTSGLSPLNGGYYAPVDSATYNLNLVAANLTQRSKGILSTWTRENTKNLVTYDQGIDSASSLEFLGASQPDLVEQQYIIELDDRLLQINTANGAGLASPSFVDDDSIASYFFSLSNTPGYFARQAGGPNVSNPGPGGTEFDQVSFTNVNGVNELSRKAIGTTDTTGLFGTRLVFGLVTTPDVRNQAVTEGLWLRLGKDNQTINFGGGDSTYAIINTVVRITGVTTGYRTDVPVTLIKNS